MENKRNFKMSFGVSLAMIAMGAYFPIIDIAVPIVVRVLGYSELVKGVILMIVNGLPIFFYPLFAKLSDNCRSKLGRRTPFIYAGTAVMAACLIGAAFSARAANIWLFAALVTLSSVAVAVYRPAAQSLMPDVVTPSFRSAGNSISNVVMAVGNFASIGLVIIFGNDYFWVFVIVAVLIAISTVVYRIFINEPKLTADNPFTAENFTADDVTSPKGIAYVKTLDKSELTNLLLIFGSIFLCNFGYTALSATIQNYSVSVWGMSDNLAAVNTICMGVGGAFYVIFAPWLSNKKGNRFAMAVTMLTVIVGLTAVMFIKSYTPWIFVLTAIYGGAWTGYNIVALPAVLNFSNIRNNGMFSSAYTIFCNLPKAITVFTSSIMINSLGYASLFPYVIISVTAGVILVIAALFQRKKEVSYKI